MRVMVAQSLPATPLIPPAISLPVAHGAQVRVVEFNSSTPFGEQLRVMSETGLFVSVHTSNLANAQFLQPGSAVLELLQRNWMWHNLDKSFQVSRGAAYLAPLTLAHSVIGLN